MFFNKFIKWWRLRLSFVIMDGNDNSVTFSRKLFQHIKNVSDDGAAPKVFVFFIPATGCYGFMLNPQIEQPTQLADIQYNAKFKCIGFECLNPTVQRILYDYGIEDYDKPCKLSVSRHLDKGQHEYYQIEKPHEKFTRHSKTL
jgi:hypothetical protein